MSRTILVAVAALGFVGCHSNAKVIGAYDTQVSAFGTMDEDMVTVSKGSGGVVLFDFAYGFSTLPGDTTAAMVPNETGLRVKVSGKKLTLAAQDVHVDYSTGEYDGSVSGTGTIEKTTLTLKLDVVPKAGSDSSLGSSVEYDITGTQEAE